MWDLKACAVCLRTDVKLYNLDIHRLRSDFNEISGLSHKAGNGLPNYLCVECNAQVKSFKKFRTKCQKANFTLLQILKHNKEILLDDIEAIDKRTIGLLPMLSNWSLDRVHYESVKFQWVKHNRFGLVKGGVPVLSVDNLTPEKDQPVPLTKEFSSEVDTNEVKLEFEFPSYSLNFNNIAACNYSNIENRHTEQDKSEGRILETSKNVDVLTDELNDDVDLCNDHNDETFSDDGNNLTKESEPHGSSLDEEYASIIPLSVKEQAAAAELYKLFSHGKYKCEICSKGYHTEKRLKVHLRMHDKHVSGYFLCELCNYYYKTDFLLQTHITEKHLYKYICRKCPEVNFDRIAAKQHFIWMHLQNGNNKHANWYESRPSWLSTRGGKRTKGIVTIRPVRKIKKLPDDFLIFSPVSQEEQYEIVKARQKSKNYLESEFKCELCYRGFREPSTYNKHLKKHDPEVSGKCICDMCKWCFRDARKMYKHMHISHLFKYSCQMCSYVCYNKAQAHGHYRWHKNFIYVCPHCNKEFTKASTRLTHIRIKHPSTCICSICGHSFVSDIGLYFHKQRAHTKEEIEMSENPKDLATAENKLYCEDCKILFLSGEAFTTHLGSSNKHTNVNLSVQPSGKGKLHKTNKEGQRGRARGTRGPSEVLNTGVATATTCEECGERLPNDVQARKHYRTQHPGTEYLKRYMCDVCGHTTKQYTNLLVHMRTHTNEKPYACPHCDRRFSMPSNRDRHLVVHTGEKRYECEHCHRRFTQSSAVKLHIQTVHLKIPYAPWDKKNRKRRKEVEVVAPQHEPPKILLDTQSEYLNAYISYHDE